MAIKIVIGWITIGVLALVAVIFPEMTKAKLREDAIRRMREIEDDEPG